MRDEIKNECYKALGCLYISVPEEVAADVNRKVKLHIEAIEAQNERLVKALEWFLKAHIDGVVLCSTIENAKLYNEKEKEAKAALEGFKPKPSLMYPDFDKTTNT